MRCIWRHVGAFIMVWNGGRRIGKNKSCEWRTGWDEESDVKYFGLLTGEGMEEGKSVVWTI
ncbi:hypothetical protein BM1374166_01869 [Bartonella tribocorum]|uniref:hypothetical protein n=1 Tax=Bartonella tribocorum TaxID=85701 RepID=UPI00043B1A1E|nr:hypothetical protein [Bartonella tribocorum]CDO49515.1 hypothetical protein BM1374166_01869 [Bartonella tribocorum]